MEVQRRSRKVDLDKFRGWCEKRDQLGAQHLICVSTIGFPKSVLKAAQLQGDSVRLITLSKPHEIPSHFQLRTVRHTLQTATITDLKVFFDPDSIQDTQPWEYPDWHVKVFECENYHELQSIYSIANKIITPRTPPLRVVQMNPQEQRREYRLVFSTPLPRVWLHKNGKRIPVLDAEITEKVEYSTTELPVEVLAYVQEFKHGLLGWTLLSKGSYEGHEYYVQLPLIRNPDGSMSMGKSESSLSRIPGIEMKASTAIIEYSIKENSLKPTG